MDGSWIPGRSLLVPSPMGQGGRTLTMANKVGLVMATPNRNDR